MHEPPYSGNSRDKGANFTGYRNLNRLLYI